MGSISHHIDITPLVINSLAADKHTHKHTNKHTHKHTHTHTHIHTEDLHKINFKKPVAGEHLVKINTL